jgi:hypothetical protein
MTPLDLERFKNRGRGFVPETSPDALGPCELSLAAGDLPSRVMLPETPTLDQGQAGTCAACICDGALIRAHVQGTVGPRLWSRLWAYWYGRVDTTIDAGMQFSNVVNAINMLGLPAEEHWPYDAAKVFDPPPLMAAQHAFDQRGKFKFHPLRGSRECMAALAIGRPIVAGFRALFGAPHAVLLVGYETTNDGVSFCLKNSWGEDFGENGYVWVSGDTIDDDQIGLWACDWTPSASEDLR